MCDVAQHPDVFIASVIRSLRVFRKEQRITAEQLAERLDTALQNVRRIEAGQNITLRTLARIAEALGAEVEIRLVVNPRGPTTPPLGRARTPSRRSRSLPPAAKPPDDTDDE